MSISRLFTLLVASPLLWAVAANGQTLDLSPGTQIGTTCFEPLAATFGTTEFDVIAKRLLSTPAESEQDAAERMVLALTLAKCEETLPAERLTRLRESLADPAAPLAISEARAALTTILPRARSRNPWSQRPYSAINGPDLAQVLVAAQAPEATINQAAEAFINPALAVHLVDVARVMQSPPASLSVKARETYGALVAVALEESAKGRSARLLLASEIGATTTEIAAIGDARTPALTRAFDRFVIESVNLPASEARGRLMATRSVLTLLDKPLPTPQSLGLLQQLVSTLKQLTPELMASRKAFAPMLPRLLSGETSIRDPGLLAAREAHAAAAEDLALLVAINDAATDEAKGRPAVREEHRHAIGRLIEASKALGRATSRDKALQDHRAVLRMVHAAVMPVPEEVRASGDEHVVRFGERVQRDADELLRSMAGKRKPIDVQLAMRVQLAREIMEFHRSAQLAEAAKATLWTWPAFEMTQEGWDALTLGLAEQSTGMMRAYISGRDDRSRELLSAGRERFAAALKIIELARRLSGNGVTPNGCLEEISPGEPDVLKDVGAEHARSIALVCLGAEELRVMRDAGEETRELEARMNEVSRRIVLPPRR